MARSFGEIGSDTDPAGMLIDELMRVDALQKELTLFKEQLQRILGQLRENLNAAGGVLCLSLHEYPDMMFEVSGNHSAVPVAVEVVIGGKRYQLDQCPKKDLGRVRKKLNSLLAFLVEEVKDFEEAYVANLNLFKASH